MSSPWLGRGRTGEAPLGHSPSRRRSCPVPTRHRHYLIPRGAGALPGQGDTRRHHVIPLGQPGAQPQTSLPLATVPGMHLGPAWLHGTAERQPRAGKWRLPCPPLPPGMHSQSRAQSTAHSSQALTDRQTDRRGQAAAIPAPPAWKNSRRLDPDQVFPQVLFDMNIKGASQIPSTVRGLKNPYHRVLAPPYRTQLTLESHIPPLGQHQPSMQGQTPHMDWMWPSSTCIPLLFPAGHGYSHPVSPHRPPVPPAWHRRVPSQQ